MNRKRRPTKLVSSRIGRSEIVLLFVGVLLLLVFVAFFLWINHQAVKRQERVFQDYQALQTRLAAQGIGTTLNTYLQVAQVVQQHAAQMVSDGDESFAGRDDLFSRVLEQLPDVRMLFYQDASLEWPYEYSLESLHREQVGCVAREWAQAGWAALKVGDDSVFVPPFYVDALQQYMGLVIPERDEKGVLQGVLVWVVDLKPTIQRYVAPVRMGASGAAYLLDEKGRILFDHETEIIGRNVFDGMHDAYEELRNVDAAMIQHLRGIDSYRFTVRRNGKVARKLVAWDSVSIGSHRFIVALSAPGEELNTALKSLRYYQLVAGNLLLLLLLLLLFVAMKRHAGRSLARSEMLNRTTIDSLDDMVLVVDENLIVCRINVRGARAVEELGLSQCKVGNHLLEAFPFLEKSVLSIYQKIFETGESVTTREERPIGEHTFHTETRRIPLIADQQVRGVITIIRDVTQEVREAQERAQFKEQMQQTQKLESLGVLAGGIAHDFNNLLVGVLGNADLARDSVSQNSPAHQYLVEIELAAKRAADLCRQMLAYSGKGRFLIKRVNLNHVVEEMAHLLEVSIPKSVVLSYHFAEDLPTIEVDVTQLRQVVMNLITNAADAIGEQDGVIVLTTGRCHCRPDRMPLAYIHETFFEGEYVFLEVRDSGCGMDEQTRTRIFDPFFSTKFTGRGLGLAAVLGILRGHEGSIEVVSSPGQGTVVKAFFPVSVNLEEEVDSVEMPSSTEVANWQAEGHILLVDDEEMVRLVGGRMLEGVGFKVRTVSSGSEAVEAVRQAEQPFDCVLLDLTMPGMDGYATCFALHELQPDLPVIISSGFSGQEAAERFKDQVIAGFIHKPYDRNQLVKMLISILN